MKQSDLELPRDRPFKVGDWLVQPALNRVTAESETRQLEPKVMELLVELASKPGDVFPRDALLDKIWSDVVVGDEVLTRAVSELRRILRDDPRAPRYVETIHKRGYRLIALVTGLPGRVPPYESRAQEELPASRRIDWNLMRWIVIAAAAGSLVWVMARVTKEREGFWRAQGPPYVVKPYTSYAGSEVTPALSPDGARVAFSWDGPERDNFDIYVKQDNTETPVRLTRHPGVDIHPVWSPDGTEIAFIRDEGAGGELFVIPSIGGEAKKLVTTRKLVGGFDWSPDSVHIACSESPEPDSSARIVTYDLRKGERHEVTAGVMPGCSDTEPEYSPDGKTFAFVRQFASEFAEICLVPTGGGEVHRLVPSLLYVNGLEWMRDGRSLIFTAFKDGSYSLWRVDTQTGNVSWVPGVGEWIYTPSIARDADRMVYHRYEHERNIWRIQLDPRGARDPEMEVLIHSSHWDSQPSLSPDGKRIAFTSTRSGALAIWISNSDGTGPFLLTSFRDCYVARPRWSPEGNRVAFSANPEGSYAVFVTDIRNRQTVRVTRPEFNALMASWSRDGQSVYFGSGHSGDWELWRCSLVDSGSDNTVRVTTGGGIMGWESVDGHAICYTKPDEPGLWQMTLGPGRDLTGVTRILSDLPVAGQWDSWAVCRAGIVVVDPRVGAPEFLLYNADSGTMESIASTPDFAPSSIAVSPDCLTLLYTRVENAFGDLMLVEGFR
jgi:Tol biopolymer transport system component/DNA-binding winged helix-turn-helix (wHTH) protein